MSRNSFRRHGPTSPGPNRNRLILIAVVMAAAFMGIMLNAWNLQVKRHAHFVGKWAQHKTSITLTSPRGAIYDNRDRALALSANVPSVYAQPRVVDDAESLAKSLAPILGVSVKTLHKRLASKRAFVWLKRHVSPSVAKAVEALGNKALGLRPEPRRFYPNRALAGSVLGFAGIDGRGLEGVERDFDRHLKGHRYVVPGLRDAVGRRALDAGGLPPDRFAGNTLKLTIDARIQEVAERALNLQVDAMDARGGVVVVMDPQSGDTLALAQTPNFDPNLFKAAKPDHWRLRSITDVLEPGSTIKPLLIAAALDQGLIRPNTAFNGYKGRLKVGRKTVTDVHGEERLNTLEIIQKSSNVGAVQVGQRLGKERWYQYLRAFGFGEPTGIGLRGEQGGRLSQPKRWGQIELATLSYGYGLSVTPLQMARATAVIANGGLLVQPRLVSAVTTPAGKVLEDFEPAAPRRVISAQAARQAAEGMYLVTQEGGTGKNARVAGYQVAGKTGTAYKVDRKLGGYSEEVRASFTGFVPLNNPALAIYVVVDEPQEAQYGGVVAAPIFATIAREILPYLGIAPTEPIDESDPESRYGADAEADQWAAEGIDPQARPWWAEQAVLSGSPTHLSVPDFKGLPLGAVLGRSAELGLEIEVKGAGLVVDQNPQPGALIAPEGRMSVGFALPGHSNLEGRR